MKSHCFKNFTNIFFILLRDNNKSKIFEQQKFLIKKTNSYLVIFCFLNFFLYFGYPAKAAIDLPLLQLEPVIKSLFFLHFLLTTQAAIRKELLAFFIKINS